VRAAPAGPLGPRNAQVKRLRSLLNDRAARRADGVFIAEGLRLIEGLLDRNAPLVAIYVEPGAHDPRRVDALLDRVEALDVPVIELEPGVAARISSTVTPQAMFAEAMLPEAALADVAAAGAPLMVLVGIQDPGNAGTIMRSAEAAGCGAVVFAADSVDPWNAKVIRASAGAIWGVAVVEEKDPVQVLEVLGDAGYTRVSTVARDGVAPDAANLSGSVAIVVGSEAHGLGADVIAATDLAVTIPMHGAVESLNAGMAATVLAFEAARQRSWDLA